MNVALVVPYPTEVAANRLRIEQYVPYLEARGWRVRVYRFMSTAFYRIVYQPGRYGEKLLGFAAATARRLSQLPRLRRADVVVVHREAFPYGPPILEEALARHGCRLVFDFDDAIYLPHSSAANRALAWLKRPSKIGRIIHRSVHTIAGNDVLAGYARRYSSHVTVIPTPVDTCRFRPRSPRPTEQTVTIGWIGSHNTVGALGLVQPALWRLADRFPHVRFLVVGGPYGGAVPRLENRAWSLEREVEDLQDLDIGIMPAFDDRFWQGKCGFKILLYMSGGVPPVCSPVGVNRDIVQDGVNGFLARDAEEWYQRLTYLVEHREARRSIGAAARLTAESRYSLAVQAPRFAAVLAEAAGAAPRDGAPSPARAARS
jgi:glycosyltransferase involved in cell wall biosynthesis